MNTRSNIDPQLDRLLRRLAALGEPVFADDEHDAEDKYPGILRAVAKGYATKYDSVHIDWLEFGITSAGISAAGLPAREQATRIGIADMWAWVKGLKRQG